MLLVLCMAGPDHLDEMYSRVGPGMIMVPGLQAEAKAAAEQQARLRAEEEARRAALQKLATAQGRTPLASHARGQAAVRVRAAILDPYRPQSSIY